MRTIHTTNRNEIINVEVPAKTKSYTPVKNEMILNTIDEMAAAKGLELIAEHYDMTANRKSVVGVLTYKGSNEELGMCVAFRNSYNKTRRFGIATGATVFACLNGMLNGEEVYNRTHTGDAVRVAHQQIVDAFETLIPTYEEQIALMEKYKTIHIDEVQSYKILGKMFFNREEEHSLKGGPVRTIYGLLQSGNENFHKADDPDFTLWDLYNHCTEALKDSHPFTFMANHTTVHTVCLEESAKY